MAKAKRSTARVAKKPEIAAVRQVKQAVKELQNFYQLGHKVLEADKSNPRKGTYSLGVSVEIAARIGRSRDYVDKARKFASTYTKAELDELCRLKRPDGMPLGPRHVIGLLRIKNKRDRKRFQRKAVVEGWSTRQVAAEISKLLSTGGSGGRRPKTPKTVDDALIQVQTMTNRWSRWYAGFDPQADNGKDLDKSRIGLDDLPEPIRKQLKSSARQIEKLKDAVIKELGTSASRAQSKRSR
jgi:hypothetical protein